MTKVKKKLSNEERLDRINKIADSLTKQFKNAGIKVLRYDSYSTNSVYLKLDNGILHTIRISDHEGKRHLSYRYNVRLDKNGINTYRDRKGYIRTVYGGSKFCIDIMVGQIMEKRKQLIKQYTIFGYNSKVKSEGIKNRGNLGFWSKAVEV